ncbi:efflux RND transporter permease subunit [Flavobacteriaceae bacterium]|uniref:efflux RND transporter permease subunit n=1 Tax=Candidatus Arcticimaribacter forsetii TaxID=2820661 RepID=UPI0020779347|nr:efflux RND transporter permease subunit [Candidatus Arcticimaribacter forsetii]MDB2329319.1 efflux RND transporter permease subunit [Flavobacteriaceae bacterium]MDB2345700.1 efflux RND transporter permease subunit [Flavobacteriaceae bacterium]MDB4620391.1 efflux RND transporter permease subunit [Flavobacteriaceae bacterium]MDB4674086.1 efflux RND transporter permease subunit [Flavobacteriaceae bacterium]MDB4715169.1 efflux RND transporter permease subunit [Flavobacteriaceae bacterium]
MKKSSELKEFSLSSWAIDHSTVIYVIISLFFLLGVSSYLNMPRENYPEINTNEVFVSSVFPGNTAEDMERLITDPLEEELKGVPNLVKITSTSLENFSLITVEFDENISKESAKIKVQDKIDAVTSSADWPTFNNAKVEPTSFEFSISEEVPILNIGLSGDIPIEEMKFYGELLQDKIEQMSEIKEVALRGVQDFEVEVSLDLMKMNAATVSFNDVINAIARGNSTVSAGNIEGNGLRRNIRVLGEIESPEELEDFVIKTQNGVLSLGDIATVSFKEKEKNSYARLDRESALVLDVKKRTGKNLILSVEKIRKIVDEVIENDFPSTIEVDISNDQSNTTKNIVSDLANNIIFGVILVITVLMFFLGFRNALFVGFAIPMSMFMSFMILGFLGQTINTMVLFGLIMGLGMLVDNGIVVVENAYRLMEKEGMGAIEAAKKGIGEIAYPIIISTATTIAAFVPLGFWPGTIGKFMIYFPITLSIVLGSSLIVAIFFNSMLVSKFMEIEDREISQKSLWRLTFILGGLGVLLLFNSGTIRGLGTLMVFTTLLFWAYKFFIKKWAVYFQNVILVNLEKRYTKVLRFALTGSKPYIFLFSTIALLFSSFIILGIASPKVEFFPENQPQQIFVYMEYPEGTSIEKTNAAAKLIEAEIFEVISQDKYMENGNNFMIDSNVSMVGAGAQNPETDKGGDQDMPHKAKITLTMSEFKLRQGLSSENLRKEIQAKLQNKYAGLSISVEKEGAGPPVGYPVNIEIKGEDYDELIAIAEQLKSYLGKENILGVEEIKIDVNKSKPGLAVHIDRKKAGGLGVSGGQIGQQMRRSLFGEKSGIFKKDGEDYDINVRFDESYRKSTSALLDQYIVFRDQASGKIKKVPISAVVDIDNSLSFSAIKHKELRRVVTVYSAVLAGYNANEVVDHVKESIAGFDGFPNDVDYQFTGEVAEQEANMSFLLGALATALGLIVFLLVLQFNSISNPLIILLSIFLSFTGVLYGISLFGMPFVIMMTMMGIISLSGIVVNNGVVLIDYTQLLIARKKEELGIPFDQMLPRLEAREAIVLGGTARLRPVLLTAITTILGLIPLATGLNIDFTSLVINWNPNIYVGGDNVIFWGPLAWTVIFGLTFATFLTLVIVPACFYLVYRLKLKIKALRDS